jgi:hypothetical protein
MSPGRSTNGLEGARLPPAADRRVDRDQGTNPIHKVPDPQA